ncbi:pentapeptide repeat-containing protein [Fictibacillus fluitans]|uniref:Pentapeptide repeat-containing protein n=1 Tax=Fictibacillus fluitans TaxID=3058422 RepID=A0ABT8HZ25_9BACL|nr:pentapeptide repeat-containing protein [Fictibacillus sp. NE201]MDN4525998.1 pentapeptide repeat-containing protein [Fictibacillus sp. NE201]
MIHPIKESSEGLEVLKADCEQCFGLCCVALPFAKSADFALNKDSGTPCPNLQQNFMCGIHQNLREKGFKGCTVYDCFGAGQKVSLSTYKGLDWRNDNKRAQEMFDVFPVMQQLHEMLYYLKEARNREETQSIKTELQDCYETIESLTNMKPEALLLLDVQAHRSQVNGLLLRTSELVRKEQNRAKKKSTSFLGAKLRKADLKGSDFRGALLIAADLREADLRRCDWIGADIRDADLSGADVRGSIFLTQIQVNAAKGNRKTKLPPHVKQPEHWLSSKI